MATPPPQAALFVNEHVGHPENRTNLALFALMMAAPIREWFLSELKLPLDAVVYPPENISGRRPDLVAVHNGKVVAWIEIELGGANISQLTDYQQAFFPTPVLSIVGPEGSRRKDADHLSLEAIALAIREFPPERLDAQQRMHADVFTRLVHDTARKSASTDYINPGAEVVSQPLVQQLQVHLGTTLRPGVPPIVPGEALVTTTTQKGWTLRVFARGAKMGSVALLSDVSIGRKMIRVPARPLLLRCLPAGEEAVDGYVAFLQKLGVNIATLAKETDSLPLPEDAMLVHAAELAHHVRALASVYGGKS